MTATPFALVSTENRARVFAYGLDIALGSSRDVITFRRDSNGHTVFGVHQSVESALMRFSLITPLELVWEPSCRCCSCIRGDETCELDETCATRLA